MNSSLNRFNAIASVYDTLSRVAFANNIHAAQLRFLKRLPPKGKILVLGGGTGWILKEIFKLYPTCTVWYVEASDRMLALSKDACPCFNDRVHFVHGTEDTLPNEIRFDAVITNFYLDLFSPKSLDTAIEKIKCTLSPNAIWLATDFRNEGKWWQQVMLWVMYRFFQITCKLEASSLSPWQQHLEAKGYSRTEETAFYGGFIVGAVYEVAHTAT